MPKGILKVKLIGDSRDLSAKLHGASRDVKSFSDKLGGYIKHGAEAAGAALVGAGIASVKLASDFQTNVAQIAANAQIPISAANAIGKAFLDTGGKTEFSANQISQAFAGVAGQLGQTEGHALDTGKALEFMRAATELATATGTDLSTVTATLGSVMQAYGLKVKDAASTTNILFNTARLTGQSVDGFTGVLAKLHSRLGVLAPSLKDIGGLMVDLAAHGISGARGVLVVNSGLQTLIGGGKKVSAELKDLGVKLFDQKGNFVGLGNAISQLQPKLAKMTTQQRLAALSTLFGKGAAQALGQVIAGGAAGYQHAINQVSKLGAVQSAAATKAKTFAVQFATIKAQVVDFGIKIGSFLIPLIEKAFGFIGPYITKIAGIVSQAWKGLLGGFNEGFSGGSGVIGVFQDIGNAAYNFVQILRDDVVPFLEDTFKAVWGVLSKVIAAVLPVFSIVAHFVVSTVLPVFRAVWNVFLVIAKAIGNLVTRLSGPLRSVLHSVTQAFEDHRKTILGVINFVKGLVQVITSVLVPVLSVVLGTALRVAGKAIGLLIDVVASLIDAFGHIKNAVGDVIGFLKDVFITGLRFVLDVFFGFVSGLLHGAAAAFGWIPGIGPKLKKARDAFDAFSAHVLGDLNHMAGGANYTATKLDKLLGSFTKLPKAVQNDIIAGGLAPYRSGNYQKLALGGFIKAPLGHAVNIVAHGGEFVMTAAEVAAARTGKLDFLKKLGPFHVPQPSRLPVQASPTARWAASKTYNDHSVTNIYNPVPEKLSETLPALRRRQQLLRSH